MHLLTIVYFRNSYYIIIKIGQALFKEREKQSGILFKLKTDKQLIKWCRNSLNRPRYCMKGEIRVSIHEKYCFDARRVDRNSSTKALVS